MHMMDVTNVLERRKVLQTEPNFACSKQKEATQLPLSDHPTVHTELDIAPTKKVASPSSLHYMWKLRFYVDDLYSDSSQILIRVAMK
jgi:hypothetical protein